MGVGRRGLLVVAAVLVGLVHFGCDAETTSSAASDAPSATQSPAVPRETDPTSTSSSEEVAVRGHGSCVSLTLEEQIDAADTIVDGTFLEGPEHDARLLGPASFEVTRYLKGDGPRELSVRTALRRDENGQLSRSSDLVDPAAGQRWILLGTFDPATGTLRTSRCDGSRPISGVARPEIQEEIDQFLEQLDTILQD